MLQAVVGVTAKFLLNVPVSTEMDSVEYMRTADNVLAGHGFSIENTPPGTLMHLELQDLY